MNGSAHQLAQEHMMQTFATPAPVTVTVDIPAGRIQVIASDRADTTVEIRPASPAKSRDVKLASQTTASYSDGTLQVAGPDGNKIFGSTGAVEVTICLPAGSSLEAKAASAQLITAGQLGQITYDSSQATIDIDQATAARLTTADGDITVGHLAGDSQIRTVNGSIHVAEATRGTLQLRSETGTITVTTPAAVSATLDAGTTIGRIRNTLTNTADTPDLTIHATTTVGDITATSL
jgi:hypothetical protein